MPDLTVIANTSPLLYLHQVGHLSIFMERQNIRNALAYYVPDDLVQLLARNNLGAIVRDGPRPTNCAPESGSSLPAGPGHNAQIVALALPATDTYEVTARGAGGTFGPYTLEMTPSSTVSRSLR